nr:MAG TPA: hypothetical protein [Caudoviricetes sp.]
MIPQLILLFLTFSSLLILEPRGIIYYKYMITGFYTLMDIIKMVLLIHMCY